MYANREMDEEVSQLTVRQTGESVDGGTEDALVREVHADGRIEGVKNAACVI